MILYNTKGISHLKFMHSGVYKYQPSDTMSYILYAHLVGTLNENIDSKFMQ